MTRIRGMNPNDDPEIDAIIEAPAILSFTSSPEDSEATRIFFEQIRTELERKGRKRTMVELAPVRDISLGAALVLVAEFDRWQRINHIKLALRTVDNWNPQVVQKLRSLGFFRLLGTRIPPRLRWTRSPEWIQFISGIETVGAAARALRLSLEKHLGRESGVGAEIYIALVECMKNAFQHAYPDVDADWATREYVGKRWWMAGTVNREMQSIRVAFFDIGITIPGSLPYSWMWPELDATKRGGGDHVLIAEAIQYGRSSLAEKHRGKGFSNIRHPTSLNESNAVSVMSGGGHCIDIGKMIFAIPLATKLRGTLIEWEFHLGEAGHPVGVV